MNVHVTDREQLEGLLKYIEEKPTSLLVKLFDDRRNQQLCLDILGLYWIQLPPEENL